LPGMGGWSRTMTTPWTPSLVASRRAQRRTTVPLP
jgi:hypothetical protein